MWNNPLNNIDPSGYASDKAKTKNTGCKKDSKKKCDNSGDKKKKKKKKMTHKQWEKLQRCLKNKNLSCPVAKKPKTEKPESTSKDKNKDETKDKTKDKKLVNGDPADKTGSEQTESTSTTESDAEQEKGTSGVSINFNAGWGVGGTVGLNLVWDSQGNIALQGIIGGGGDVPSISLTANSEYTNATDVFQLDGIASQAGVEGGEVLVVEAGGIFGKGYSGWYAGAGVGFGAPVGVSGFVTDTSNLLVINVYSIINSAQEAFGY